jgi:hypothetical protein
MSTPNLTKGIKSTEFWLSLLAMLASFFVASGALPDTHWAVQAAALLVAALASLGYSNSRGTAKAAALAPVDPVAATARDDAPKV